METDDITLANSGSDHEMTPGPAPDAPPAKMDTDSDQPLANDCTSQHSLSIPLPLAADDLLEKNKDCQRGWSNTDFAGI